VNYVKNQHFQYTTKTDQLLKDLKESTEKENYDADIKEAYAKITADIETAKKNDLVKNKEEIKGLLEEEIATRYYYEKGRIQVEIANDKETKKGIALLNDDVRYDSIIKTIVPATRPFHNPEWNAWPPSNAK
jgi:carboxyl-terminal processing protease